MSFYHPKEADLFVLKKTGTKNSKKWKKKDWDDWVRIYNGN